jgi:hypothetical protein
VAAVSAAGAAESLQPKRPLPSTDEFYRDAGARIARLARLLVAVMSETEGKTPREWRSRPSRSSESA